MTDTNKAIDKQVRQDRAHKIIVAIIVAIVFFGLMSFALYMEHS